MTNWVPEGWNEPPFEPHVVVSRAGLSIRIVAKIADVMVFSMVASTVGFVFGGFASRGPSGPLVALAALASWMTTMVVLESRVGWTPGKMIVGLRVRTEDGTLPGLFQTIVRHACYSVGLLPVVGRFVGLPAVISVAYTIHRDPDARGWHDRIAGTVVQRVERSPLA